MATMQEIRDWVDAIELLRADKRHLREPYLSLVAAYEKELAKLEAEEPQDEKVKVSVAVN